MFLSSGVLSLSVTGPVVERLSTVGRKRMELGYGILSKPARAAGPGGRTLADLSRQSDHPEVILVLATSQLEVGAFSASSPVSASCWAVLPRTVRSSSGQHDDHRRLRAAAKAKDEVAFLTAGRFIDMECGVRYGIIGESVAADKVKDRK